MAHTVSVATRVGPLLTVSEVAVALRTSRGSVYRHIREGRLAAVRFGAASVRVPAAALDKFLEPVGAPVREDA